MSDDPGKITARSYNPQNGNALNPERGGCVFYGNGEFVHYAAEPSKVREDGYTLVCASINLSMFRDGDIDADFLTALNWGFSKFRAAGVKTVIRFHYGPRKDATMSQIGSHIKELGPLLSKNADVIAALQAGFIGSYGEWHTSANLLEGAHEQMAVLSGLLHILPSSQIQVRKPQFKQDYIKFNRNSSADAARIGHHIDCFGSGETHGGTFPEEESAKWIAFIGKEYPNTAVGGETCNPGGLKSAGERSPEQIMTCEDAKEQMRELRWSYLNVSGDGSDGGVINSWRSAGCYKEMLGNMGYRLELEDASWNADLRAAGVMNLNFSIANRGYAALFSERFVYAVLKNGSKTYKAKLPLDARTLLPGQGASRMSFTLRIPRRIEPGQYALALWLPDRSPSLEKDPRFAVALSNEGIWESETGLNILDPAVQIGKYEGDQRASTQSNFIENR